MVLSAEASCLLVIDCQEKLMPAIHGGDELIGQIGWLTELARALSVPVLASEQYPRGLGRTVSDIDSRLEPDEKMEKLRFSCAAEPTCRGRLEGLGRRQVVVGGVEAHVCVLQTALGMLGQGWEVFVVDEAVSSRRPRDRELALERMRQAGVVVVSREMVAFEWLHEAGTDLFRDISRRFLR